MNLCDRLLLPVLLLTLAVCASGCTTIAAPSADLPLAEKPPVALTLVPSNHRDWEPSLAETPMAAVLGDEVEVFNIRNCDYMSETEYVVNYRNEKFDLRGIRSVDFIVVPFTDMTILAHTFISFGFADGRYLAVSAEVRLEKGETYNPLLGAMRQYEIMYVVADERDVIGLRTEIRDVDVYVHRTKATPEDARRLFLDVMARCNELAVKPEFYDTLTNNCTTSVISHVNRLWPKRIAHDYRTMLPGFSAKYAYDLGLLETKLPFEQAKKAARVNDLAHVYLNDPAFSRKIRGEQ